MTLLLLALQLFNPVDPATFAAIHEQRIATLEPNSAEARQAHRDLGLFWLRNSRPEQAEPHLRKALPDAEVIPFLAEAVAAQRRNAEAETLFAQCPDRARCLSRLAQFAEQRGDLSAAIRHYREALALEPTGVRRNDLALALREAGEAKEAERQFRAALADQEKSLGPRHPETASTLNNLAMLLLAADRVAEAEPLQRRALAIFERSLGPHHLRTGLAASNLADMQRDAATAKPLYRKALEIFRANLPANHPWIREAEEAMR